MANNYQSLSTLQYVILGDKTYYVLESGTLQEIKEASSIIKALADILINPHKLLFVSSSNVSGTTIQAVILKSMMKNADIQCNGSLISNTNKTILSSLTAECMAYIQANTVKNILTSSALYSISDIYVYAQKNLYKSLMIQNTSEISAYNAICFYNDVFIEATSNSANYPLKYSHLIPYDTLNNFSFNDLMNGLIVLGISVVDTAINSISSVFATISNIIFKNASISGISSIVADYIIRMINSSNISANAIITAFVENIASISSIINSVSSAEFNSVLRKYSESNIENNSYAENLPLSYSHHIPHELLDTYRYQDLINGLLIRIAFIVNEHINSSSIINAIGVTLKNIVSKIDSAASVYAELLNSKHTASHIYSRSDVYTNIEHKHHTGSTIRCSSIVFNLPFKYGDEIPYEFLVKYTYEDLYNGRIHLRTYLTDNAINCSSTLISSSTITNVIRIDSISSLNADCIKVVRTENISIPCISSVKAKAHIKKVSIKGKTKVEINKKYKVVVKI